MASWFIAQSVSRALVLGMIWSRPTRSWAFAIWAAIASIPFLAEALTDAVEARGEPRNRLHQLSGAIVIALLPDQSNSYDDGGGDC